MAQCVQSVLEFVQDSFVPLVAVLCSEEAERVTRKNNLNFAELLRPFCRLTSDGKSNYLEATMSIDCQSEICHQLSFSVVASIVSLSGVHWTPASR